MATIPLPPDFSEFLRLLNSYDVKYLLVGGYAVGFYGYVRATADMDVWIKAEKENASRVVAVLQEFGFAVPDLKPELFERENQVVRMGVPPVRIEILTTISGVTFDECYERRWVERWDNVEVSVISLSDLKQNKRVSGRLKDLSDLEYLE
jgi:hypothetical protein